MRKTGRGPQPAAPPAASANFSAALNRLSSAGAFLPWKARGAPNPASLKGLADEAPQKGGLMGGGVFVRLHLEQGNVRVRFTAAHAASQPRKAGAYNSDFAHIVCTLFSRLFFHQRNTCSLRRRSRTAAPALAPERGFAAAPFGGMTLWRGGFHDRKSQFG